MDSSNPASLQNLHPIIEAATVPLWPPAPAWYVVLVLAATGVAWLGWKTVSRWRRNAYRRAALNRLSHLQVTEAEQLPLLLKQASLCAFGRRQIAQLSGEAWHGFLDQSSHRNLFLGAAGQFLDQASYRPQSLRQDEFDQLHLAVETWLRVHRPGETRR